MSVGTTEEQAVSLSTVYRVTLLIFDIQIAATFPRLVWSGQIGGATASRGCNPLLLVTRGCGECRNVGLLCVIRMNWIITT